MSKVKESIYKLPSFLSTFEKANLLSRTAKQVVFSNSYDDFGEKAHKKNVNYVKTQEYLATDKDKEDFFRFNAGKTFEKLGLDNPFVTYDGKAKAILNDKAELYTENEINKMSPEQQPFAIMRNQMIAHKGGIPDPNFIRRTFAHSTMGQIGGLLGADILGDNEFGFYKDGLHYKGAKLNLEPKEVKLLTDYINRISGADAMKERSFLGKAFETAVTFAWDLPLIGGIGKLAGAALTSDALVGRTVARAMRAAPNASWGYRQLAKLPSNIVVFQGLELPQTIKAVREQGIDAGIEKIGHSMMMAALMSSTSALGEGVMKVGEFTPMVKGILRSSPALKEELAGALGTTVFGYSSSKFAGESDEDALATALAFLSTHIANPTALKRVIEEHKTSGVKIRFAETPDGQRIKEDYFVERDGKGYLIDEELLKNDGRIAEVEGAEPIELSKKTEELPYYNERYSRQFGSFAQALKDDALLQVQKQFLKDFKKSADKKEFKKNYDMYVTVSGLLARGMATEKWAKLSADYKLPDKNVLAKESIRLSNELDIPYNTVKRMLITNFLSQDFKSEIGKASSLGAYAKAIDNITKAYLEGVEDKIRTVQLERVDKVLKDYFDKQSKDMTDREKEIARMRYYDIMSKLTEKRHTPEERDDLIDAIRLDKRAIIEDELESATDGSPYKKILEMKLEELDKLGYKKEIEKLNKEDKLKVEKEKSRPEVTNNERTFVKDNNTYESTELAKDIAKADKQFFDTDSKILDAKGKISDREVIDNLSKKMTDRNKAKSSKQNSEFMSDLSKVGLNIDEPLKKMADVLDKLGVQLKPTRKGVRNFLGRYMPDENLMELNLDINHKDKTFTWVHEGIHALEDHLPDNVKEEFKKESFKLQTYLADKIAEDIRTKAIPEDVLKILKGIGNVAAGRNYRGAKYSSTPLSHYEIYTYGLTEPSVARYFASLPATPDYVASIRGGRERKVTFLTQILDMVKKLFKSVNPDEISFLEEVEQTFSKYVDKVESKKTNMETENLGTSKNLETTIASKTKQDLYKTIPKKESTDKVGSKGLEENMSQNDTEIKYSKAPEDRKIEEDPKPLMDYQRIQDERNQDNVKTFTDKMGGNPKLLVKQMLRQDKNTLSDLGRLAKEYTDLSLPPMFFAENHPKFRKLVHKYGEEMIRVMPHDYNSIMQWKNGLANFTPFIKMIGGKGALNDPKLMTEDGRKFLEAIDNYNYARGKELLDHNLGWEEFGKWAGFNDTQMNVLHRFRRSIEDTVARLKRIKIMDLKENEKNIIGYLSDKQLTKLFGKDILEADGKLNREKLNESLDDKAKDKVARFIVNKLYSGWGKTFYYNESRPSDPDTHIIEMQKKVGEDANGEPIYEPLYSYAHNEVEVESYIADMKKNGYDLVDTYQIKKLIQSKDFNRLTAQQIKDLAIKGHLDFNDPKVAEAIRKLEEATVKGVAVHNIHKGFVRGMHYTPKELVNQYDAFVKQAIYGGYKSYYLKKIDKNLTDWSGKYNTNPERDSKEKFELEYAIRYTNQLKQKERTMVDGIRGWAQTFQVGIFKPSFLVQQAAQIFQTTFSGSIADGGSTGVKNFHKGIVDSFKAIVKMKALAQGYDRDIIYGDDKDISRETVERLRTLERMNKIGAQGLEELTADAPELEATYIDTPLRRHSHRLKELSNVAGKAVERWSRIVTALTYENIGLEKGLQGKELVKFMADGIDKNMSEWGKGGRAPLFNSKQMGATEGTLKRTLAKTFMTYKTFSFYNYGLWRSMIHNKQYGALFSKIAMGIGTSGITRMPLMASMMALVDLFSGDDDDIGAELWQVADYLDEKLPNTKVGTILHRGLPGVWGWDLRETFGQDTPLFTDLYANSWAQSWHGKMIEIGLGAPFGFTKDMTEGGKTAIEFIYNDLLDDNYYTENEKERIRHKAMKMMPVTVKNIISGIRLEKDGFRYKNKVRLTRDDLTSWDILSKMMSFQIAKQTRVYDNVGHDALAKYNRAKQVVRRAATHRKEFAAHLRKQGIKGEAFKTMLEEEVRKSIEDKMEAKKIMKELESQVKEIKRKLKLKQKV